MIRLCKFEMEHLEKFDHLDYGSDIKADMQYNIDMPNRTAFSLFRGDEVIALAGVSDFRPGVGEVWVIKGSKIPEFKVEFFKTIYRLVHGFALNRAGYHRLEMAVDCEWEEGPKWAEKLGFEFMGISKAYDLNYKDHKIYQLVRY